MTNIIAAPPSAPTPTTVLPMSDWTTPFRSKANYMKTWKPASSPSNRDRLELYALHKQAVSGDAPDNLLLCAASSSSGGSVNSTSTPVANTLSAADRAKAIAWQGKRGMSQQEAMRLYIHEADRQVRVYGIQAPVPPTTPTNTPGVTTTNTHQQQQQQQQRNRAAAVAAAASTNPRMRGLAAIPLLCAAAAESRTAYLRRLAHTELYQAWWRRQEPLTAMPGSIAAWPEHVIIILASAVEWMSLAVRPSINDAADVTDSAIGNQSGLSTWLPSWFPETVFQSWLWPCHNACLAMWMACIITLTVLGCTVDIIKTILLGSRRTGLSLETLWKEPVQGSAQAVHTLTEHHQPLSARLVGLVLLPVTMIVALWSATVSSHLWSNMLFAATITGSLWYWCFVLPWLAFFMLCTAISVGVCYALIELAGV